MNYQGHIVDAVNREIFDGILSVENGRIVEVKRCELPRRETPWPYYLPGFIDSHVHIESSMMVPLEFARIAVSHGTIGVVADPHEIANVLGVEGVDFMIQSGSHAQFNFCFGAPSCVPAVGGDVETCGATIDAEQIEKLREMVHDIGCTMQSPFITMAFMALPVIPNLKITDRHLMDTKNMQIIEK